VFLFYFHFELLFKYVVLDCKNRWRREVGRREVGRGEVGRREVAFYFCLSESGNIGARGDANLKSMYNIQIYSFIWANLCMRYYLNISQFHVCNDG
jgi:hypothetical protein